MTKNELMKKFPVFYAMGAVAIVAVYGIVSLSNGIPTPNSAASLTQADRSHAAGEPQQLSFTTTQTFNQDGSQVDSLMNPRTGMNSQNAWIGNGKSLTDSYFGMVISRVQIPPNTRVSKAYIRFVATEQTSTPIMTRIYGDATPNFQSYSRSLPPNSRVLSTNYIPFNVTEPWQADIIDTPDISALLNEIVVPGDSAKDIGILVKGMGQSAQRRNIFGQTLGCSNDGNCSNSPLGSVYAAAPVIIIEVSAI